MKSKKTLLALVLSVALLSGIAALVISFVFQSTPAQASANDGGHVRVIHAAPGAGNVDVFVDGKKLLSNFAFGKITDYVELSTGSHKFQVAPAGKGAGDSVITANATISSGKFYTVAALGTKESGFSAKVFADDTSILSNKARVRVYHLSPNAGPVKVAAGGKTVISELSYTNASSYLAVAPGTYKFEVTAINANVTLPLSATLHSDRVYSVFAVGLYKGSPALQFVVASTQ